MKLFVVTLGLLVSGMAPALAQSPPEVPGQADAARITAGSYKADSAHTQVVFTLSHMGFSDFHGLIGGSTGTLTLDPKTPESAKVEIEIPLAQVLTTSKELDAHLQTPDFFDVAKFPTATFRSTKVEIDGEEAQITGDLTIHGVTKPVVLDAEFTGAGVNPMTKAETVGFAATTSIRRSEFGISFGVPVVSDEVSLDITVAFEKAK